MWKKNICFIGIVVISLALEAYGLWMHQKGYELTEGGVEAGGIAYAFLSLRDGVFPWTEVPEYLSSEVVEIPDEQQEEIPEEPEEDEPAVEEEPAAEEEPAVEEPVPDEAVPEEPEEDEEPEEEEPEEEKPLYTFVTVDESYFEDAVFIGDSRIVGVAEYAGMKQAHYLAKTSMNIYKMMETKPETDRSVGSVREGLEAAQYGKVYIKSGLNEAGIADAAYFGEQYRKVIEEIRELQPDAIIYIQAIMHVSAKLDKKDKVFKNVYLNERNQVLKELAEEMHCIYIDANEVYDDEDGNLQADLTSDGVHLKANCYDAWREYLMTHAVEELPSDWYNGEE